MKYKKLLTLVIAALVLTLTMVTANAAEVVASGECGENLAWTLTDDGTLTVSGTGPMWDYEWGGEKAEYLAYADSILSIVLEEGVTSIGSAAFQDCFELTRVSLSNTLTSIGGAAFVNCCTLADANIPASVTYVGGMAFNGCPCVREDEQGFQALSGWALGYTGSETQLVIPDSITNIGPSVFENHAEITSLVLHDGVNVIGDNAFNYCTGLTELTLGAGVTSIGRYAFSNCSGLTELTIPDSVVEIGYSAFSWCSGLTKLTLGNSVVSIGDYAFCECAGLTELILPASTSSIGENAFWDCTGLKTVVMTDAVTELGCSAFYNCSAMTDVTLSNSLTSIPDYAFAECESLTNVIIPETVTSIGNYAFALCDGLKEITIPAAVTSIGDYAFNSFSQMDKVQFNGDAPAFGESVFFYVPVCYYPADNDTWTEEAMQSCTLVSEWIPYGGEHVHEYTTAVTAPTCTEQGYTTYTCECGDSYVADYTEPTGHMYSANTVPPTCTEQGYITYTCACGDSYTSSYMDATGHNWGAGVVTTQPTEESEGVCTYTCTACGETKTESIPALEHTHSYTAVVTAPTCTEQGYTTYTCECGDSYVTDYTDPAHELVYVANEPTCTQYGDEAWVCKHCGYVDLLMLTDPPTGQHSYDDEGVCMSCGKLSLHHRFVDVPANAWYYNYVDFVVERGLMNGTSATTFAPTTVINRASVAVLLWNMAGQPENNVTENPFNDVKENFWYTKAIFWAYENGVVSGNGAGGFNPNNDVTREQLAVMLFNFAKFMGYDLPATKDVDLNSFPDGDKVSVWASGYLKWACDLGLINGKAVGGQTLLAPKDTATRAEIAVIFTNFTKLVESN